MTFVGSRTDNHECVYPVLLDLSATFDKIDHDMFLERLENDYVVTGNVADWMKSYLLNRTQTIAITLLFLTKYN